MVPMTHPYPNNMGWILRLETSPSKRDHFCEEKTTTSTTTTTNSPSVCTQEWLGQCPGGIDQWTHWCVCGWGLDSHVWSPWVCVQNRLWLAAWWTVMPNSKTIALRLVVNHALRGSQPLSYWVSVYANGILPRSVCSQCWIELDRNVKKVLYHASHHYRLNHFGPYCKAKHLFGIKYVIVLPLTMTQPLLCNTSCLNIILYSIKVKSATIRARLTF